MSFLLWSLRWLVLGAALAALSYQLPARHAVTVGWNDGGYVQGFGDAVNRWGVVTDGTDEPRPYRWSRASSALIFPQVGLPAEAGLRWRGWRPPGEPHPRVRVLLNGVVELGTFTATGDWEEHTFAVRGGLWKPRDVFLQIETTPTYRIDGEERGVQLDSASLRTAGWPILPYPAQLVGAALTAWLLALAAGRRPRLLLGLIGAATLIFLLLYRLQVLPYPPRLLWPGLVGLALAALLVRQASRGALRDRRLLDAAAVAAIFLWGLAVGLAGRAHVVLARPGVENDFRVFATRSEMLLCPSGADLTLAGCVLRADGFYQLGYPFALWLVRPLTAGNPFAAGQVVALLASVALLGGTYGLGRSLLGPAGGLLALLLAALNRWTVEYALLLGTDMPFAAACTLATLALVRSSRNRAHALLAGLLCGIAFLIRHPGIVLLPLGAALLLRRPSGQEPRGFPGMRLLVYLLLGFVLAALPQLVVNTLQTGRPLYSQQAKNIWLAVYGNTDWERWGDAVNSIPLADVVLHEPGRFLANWWGNVRGFLGTGAEDTSEFGRALGIRLLAFPANLLALAGLLRWLLRGRRPERWLLIVALLYVLAISVGFMLPRFVLPLVPLWAVAAAGVMLSLPVPFPAKVGEGENVPLPRSPITLGERRGASGASLRLVLILVLLLLISGSWTVGVRAVLDRQDPDAAAAVSLVRQTVQGSRVSDQLPADDPLLKYSAIGHLAAVEGTPGAQYILRDDEQVPDAGTYRQAGRAGRYVLWEATP